MRNHISPKFRNFLEMSWIFHKFLPMNYMPVVGRKEGNCYYPQPFLDGRPHGYYYIKDRLGYLMENSCSPG
ncbi:unnamed protein product [Moneuplotes crassus]|uniref:Uncharacterized protein n=1 Tax=Euplotes crassus TaxID=5936 RepID=A0AAD1XSN8_EUPCR|nr:unnamed protein product [Moneuplotes crassus]